MEAYESVSAALQDALSHVASRIAEHLPNLLGALGLLVLEVLLHRLSRGQIARSIPSGSAEIVAGILFWVVILFFAAAATQVLGMAAFASWLQGLVPYLPTLMAGALIIIVGVLMAGLARDLTVAALSAFPEHQRLLLGRIVQ